MCQRILSPVARILELCEEGAEGGAVLLGDEDRQGLADEPRRGQDEDGASQVIGLPNPAVNIRHQVGIRGLVEELPVMKDGARRL
jgi:hypothetical protein